MCLMNNFNDKYIYRMESVENFVQSSKALLTKSSTGSSSGLRYVYFIGKKIAYSMNNFTFCVCCRLNIGRISKNVCILFASLTTQLFFIVRWILNGIFYLLALFFFYNVGNSFDYLLRDVCWLIHG